MSIPRVVICVYRPKRGKEAVLLAEVRDHHHLLRSEGLATDRPPVIMRAKDGAILEVFEWASPAAIEEAHANPRVQAMWARFGEVCALAEAAEPFAEFEPMEIHFPPVMQPDPDHRAK
jgi:hypothetical protein